MIRRLLEFYAKFESVLVAALLVLMMLVVLLATLEFVFLLVDGTIEQLRGVGSVEFMKSRMHAVFAGFLVILLGIELMETIKMYLVEHVMHVEVVFLVAMIAVGRHIIELDYDHGDPLMLFGIASVILALAAGYFLIKKKGD